MLRIFLHVLFLPALMGLQRRMGYRPAPALLTLAWYASGVPLMIAESLAVTGNPFGRSLLESGFVALFYVPAVWLSFRHVAWRKTGPLEGTLVYLAMSAIVTVVVSLLLAQAPSVRGFAS